MAKKVDTKKVRQFSKPAVKKVIDYNKSAVRLAAVEAVNENPIMVEKGGDIAAVMINMQKRVYYALKCNAGSAADRAHAMKVNAKKIEAAGNTLDTMIETHGWSSMAEVKTYLRSKTINGKCLFDARVEMVNNKPTLVWSSK